MEQNQRNAVLAVLTHIVRELLETSSFSDSDEELELITRCIRRRKNVPRVKNYVELIVPALSDQQFKAHFRYCNIKSNVKHIS